MARIKDPSELDILREAGKRHARILSAVAASVRPGIATKELDAIAMDLLHQDGDEAAFLNYSPHGSPYPYPAAVCISINEEVVHGIPSDRVLIEGDIVSLDFGVKHKGMITDAAITVSVGDIPEQTQKLIDLTRGSLYAGIDAMKAGNRIGDIGAAIEAHVKPHRLGLIRDLGGHGVGHAVHEEPFVPNFGTPGTGPILSPGMVLAIEPMFTLGSPAVVVEEDGYTIRSADRSLSAHFEHTIIITDQGPEVITEFES